MGLLAAALAVALAACYSPDVRDCTVTCSSAEDCSDGQVCGSDHLCAAPAVAGRCASHGGSDIPPDAATRGVLTVSIGGHGSVDLGPLGRCDYTAEPCVLSVPLDGGPIAAAASSSDDWHFDMWDVGPCTRGTDTSCSFAPSPTLSLGAKFVKDAR